LATARNEDHPSTVERMHAKEDLLSDESLMLAFAKDDMRAFEILYKRHKDRVYRYVRRQCVDRYTAEDLVHDIWMKLVRGRHRYRATAPFTTYLFTLAHHRLIDYYRSQGRDLKTGALDAEALDAASAPSADEPAMRAHARGLLERALALMETLPPLQREAVLLYVQGVGVAEIGAITGVNAETARSRVRHALRRLRRHLEGVTP
jgi:RNA polymerase sigma-70 factor (ECF subfamily)